MQGSGGVVSSDGLEPMKSCFTKQVQRDRLDYGACRCIVHVRFGERFKEVGI